MLRKYTAFFAVLLLFPIGLIDVAASGLVAAEPSTTDLKVLELLPDDTLVAVIVPKLSDLDTKVAKLGGPLKFPVPGLLTMAKAIHGVQQGLDEERSAAMVLLAPSDGKGGDPSGVGFLPTSDYQKLIGQFAPQNKGNGINLIKVPGASNFLLAQKADYAVFVGPTEEEQKILGHVLAKPAEELASLTPLKSWIAQQDAAMVITQAGVKLLTRKFLDGMKDGMAKAQAQGRLGASPEMLAQFEQYATVAQQEITRFGVGMRIEDDATVRINSKVQFAKGGNWAKAGSNVPSLRDPPLTNMPLIPIVFAFDGSWGGSAGDWMSNLTTSMMKPALAAQSDANISDDDLKKLTGIMKSVITGVNSMSMVMGVPEQGGSVYSNTYGAMRVDDSTAYLKAYESKVAEMQKLFATMNNPMFGDYEIKKSETDGVETLEITTDMSKMIKQMKDRQPGVAALGKGYWDTMLGPDGKMSIYLVAADPKTVVLVYVNPDHVKTAIDAVKQSDGAAAADSDLKTTVALLPKDANWTAFISPAGAIQFGKSMMQTIAPQLPFHFPDFPKTPPVGVSARITAEGLDVQLVVPSAILDGVGTYLQQIRQ